MEKVKLITEECSDIQLIESENSRDFYVQGIFSSAELKNKNGRMYKKSTLEREVNRLTEEINNKSLYGELNHPSSPEIDLNNVAILIENVWWKGNDLYGKASVLDTPKGQIIKAIMKKGKVGISSRGLGSVNEDGYVNDKSYKMITWDIVGNPSNIPSWINGIYESKEWIITDDGRLLEEKTMPLEEKKEAQEDAKNELWATLSPELIQLVAEDKGLSITDSKEIYKNIVKSIINEIVEKKI